MGHRQRTAARPLALFRRHRITSHERLETAELGPFTRDDHPRSKLVSKAVEGGSGHLQSGLARRNERAAARRYAVVGERAIDERAGIGAAKSGGGYRGEIAPKVRERTCQWVCLGSDQAERPVTMSNFLRSELTNWLALS